MFRRKKVEEPEPAAPESKKEPSVDKELEVIYGTPEGAPTDFTKLDVRKKSGATKVLIWVLVTLLVVAGAAYGGYVIFQKAINGTSETLSLEINGPDEVKSGEEVQFDVVYQNQGTVPLANLEIKLSVPEGLALSSTEPAPTSSPTIWNVGSITPGSDGLIRLKGTWIDPVPSGQTIQAIANYRPANFSSDFQDIATKAVAIRTSTLSLVGTGQTTAVPGDNATYTYTIKNDGDQAVGNMHLRVAPPASFIVSSSDPDPLQPGQPEWQIESLAPGEERTITLSGAFAADASGLQTLHASVGIMRSEAYLEQASTDIQTDVVGGGLSLRLIANGSTDRQTVDLGESLRLSIDATNGGGEQMAGLSVTLTVSSAAKTLPINWGTADLNGGELSVGTVTWSGNALEKGGLLPGNDRETIDLTLPLVETLGTAADELTLTVSANVSSINGMATSRTVQSTPLSILINSDVAFDAAARYYDDGAPVGTGPLPPTMGQTTSYRLFWTIDNSLHPLDNTTVSATIPPDVNYVGSVETDIGTVNFDTTTRTLTWTIDRLPTSVTHVRISFDVSVTPGSADLGKFIKLINESSLTATDSKTEARISETDGPLTTELPDDENASGKGAVIE